MHGVILAKARALPLFEQIFGGSMFKFLQVIMQYTYLANSTYFSSILVSFPMYYMGNFRSKN
jgi:hypothetical protein